MLRVFKLCKDLNEHQITLSFKKCVQIDKYLNIYYFIIVIIFVLDSKNILF